MTVQIAEVSVEAAAPITADPASRLTPPPVGQRKRLLLGTVALGAIAVLGLGIFLLRPPAVGPASPAKDAAHPVAPAALLATLPVLDHPASAAKTQVQFVSKADSLREVLAYGSGPSEAAPPTNAATATASQSGPQPAERAETIAMVGEVGVAAGQTIPAAPLSLNPAPAPPAAAEPAKKDVVATAVALQAAPMAEPQQVEVLSLVTELGVLIRDVRSDIAGLRADQQRATGAVDARLADFDRRLGLAEAKGAIAAAMGGARTAVAEADSPAPPIADPRPASETRPAKASAVPTEKPHYRVQAASPGLAMLAELGSEAAKPLEIAVGDEVPGYGRVTAIGQRGAAWVVQTQHGAIQ